MLTNLELDLLRKISATTLCEIDSVTWYRDFVKLGRLLTKFSYGVFKLSQI
jgi:hypothetical protein